MASHIWFWKWDWEKQFLCTSKRSFPKNTKSIFYLLVVILHKHSTLKQNQWNNGFLMVFLHAIIHYIVKTSIHITLKCIYSVPCLFLHHQDTISIRMSYF
jgi:hypothetical protein